MTLLYCSKCTVEKKDAFMPGKAQELINPFLIPDGHHLENIDLQ